MAGYYGYSMSNNAVDAYLGGEKPLSKWTKAGILSAARDCVPDANDEGESFDEIISALSALPLAVLRERLLVRSSWHHTSKLYNQTDFYMVDDNVCAELTKQDIQEWASEYAERRQQQAAPQARRVMAEWDVWEGSRRHPRKRTVRDSGTIKGEWFFPDNLGGKKKIGGNWFRILEELSS